MRCLYGKYGVPLGNVPSGIKAVAVHGKNDDEERPPFTKDNMWDAKEFETKWKAAGIDAIHIQWEGGHEMPEYRVMEDPVHFGVKKHFEELLPQQESDDVTSAVAAAMGQAQIEVQ